jgi:hypothetical protein
LAHEYDSSATCCSKQEVAVFVQYGSYFTKCISCGGTGPATSWLAIARRLPNPVRAVVVNERYEEVSFVAEGEGHKIAEQVSIVAYSGNLVRLDRSSDSA